MYAEENRPEKQNRVEGIALDPNHPDDFYSCEHGKRPADELRDWWGVPFVSSHQSGEFWVKALTTGAWDRPCELGYFATLQDAVEFCHTFKNGEV